MTEAETHYLGAIDEASSDSLSCATGCLPSHGWVWVGQRFGRSGCIGLSNQSPYLLSEKVQRS